MHFHEPVTFGKLDTAESFRRYEFSYEFLVGTCWPWPHRKFHTWKHSSFHERANANSDDNPNQMSLHNQNKYKRWLGQLRAAFQRGLAIPLAWQSVCCISGIHDFWCLNGIGNEFADYFSLPTVCRTGRIWIWFRACVNWDGFYRFACDWSPLSKICNGIWKSPLL